MFAGDGNLGLDNARVVVLRGTTTVSQLFSPNLFPINEWIKTGLENRGFSVNAVRTSAAGIFTGYQNNVEIELNVYNEYTAEQARQNAIAAIEDYRANYGLNKVFSNTTLDVVSDAFVYQAGNLGTVNVYGGGNTRPASSPPSAYNLNPAAPNGQPAASGSDAFWSALGLTAAPSATVLILGIGVIAIIALKK